MKKVILLLACLCLAAGAQTKSAAFIPQSTFRGVTLWMAQGCLDKPVSGAALSIIVARHNLTYLAPATATDLMSKRSVWANIAKYGGIAASIVTGLMTVKFIEANSAWVEAGTGLSTVLGIAVPMASKNVPEAQSGAGGDLTLGTNGCGSAWFYALESKGTGPFVEALQ